jgi:Ca-activated chloride channel family protein
MIRLHGPDQETIEQIVQLSIRYGIVTPYTSYLVTEQMPLGENELERITSQQLKQMQSTVDAPTFGQEAVESAAAQSSLAEAETPLIQQGEVMEQVRFVGARTFLLADGVWIDTTFDPDKMSATRVAFLSDEYFALTETDSQLAAATPTPAVHLPIISKAGTTEAVEPPTDDTSATAPLPCLGGMLLVAAIPLALLMRARNGIRDRIP